MHLQSFSLQRGMKWQQHDALVVSTTETGLSAPVRRSADGKAACLREETSLKEKNKKNKAQFNQIKTRLNRTAPGSGLGALLSYLVQSSPSSGVISVSLCTTTLVTDMSGCCSLASFMAWARAYIRECSAKRDHQGETENGERQGGSGGCWIVSQYANREVIFSHISYTSRIC